MLSGWNQGLQVATKSDIGMRRGNNQDSMAAVLASDEISWCQRGHVFMVADGMGAHAAGELASKLAVDNVPHTYHKLHGLPAPAALVKAVGDANKLIHNRGQASADFEGMGTTCTTLVLLPQGALIGHVGDSRGYRLRDGRLEQLTFDHSLVWEMIEKGLIESEEQTEAIPKNVITRSLGPNAVARVDLEGPFPIEVGDTFLLCSDGLTGQVSDAEIGAILEAMPVQEAVETLVDLANLRGGPDNITVVIVRVTGPLISEQGLQRAAVKLAEAGQIHKAPREVNPVVWVALGVCVLATGFFAIINSWIAAGISLLGVMVAGTMAIMQGYDGSSSRHPLGSIGGPFGKGPHRSCQATPQAEVTEKLAQTVDRLLSMVTQGHAPIDLDQLRQLRDSGQEATDRQDYRAAVGHYCSAIRFVVRELRSTRQKQA